MRLAQRVFFSIAFFSTASPFPPRLGSGDRPSACAPSLAFSLQSLSRRAGDGEWDTERESSRLFFPSLSLDLETKTLNRSLHTHKKKQELGIAAADLKRLKEGGINTIECLAHATKKELCLIKGISEAKVVKMQQEGK